MTDLDQELRYDDFGRPDFFYPRELIEEIKHQIPDAPLLHAVLETGDLAALAHLEACIHRMSPSLHAPEKPWIESLRNILRDHAISIALSREERYREVQGAKAELAARLSDYPFEVTGPEIDRVWEALSTRARTALAGAATIVENRVG